MFILQLGPSKDDDNEGGEEEETLEKWRLEKMEKEKWMQEFEKKQSRKRGYEDDDEDVGEGEDDKDSQFFKLADKTLMRMISKDDSADITDDAGDAFKPKPQQDNKVFKSPTKFGPLQPLQNMVTKAFIFDFLFKKRSQLFQGKTIRGSFIARGEQSLDKIAQFNKVKDDKVGSGVKGTNFVFAPVSPAKDVVQDDESVKRKTRSSKSGPPAKKQKTNRTLDENTKGTIFNLL